MAGNFSTEVIGDFVEKDAAGYFQRLLAARNHGNAAAFVQDTKAWADVYGTCGGNPLGLQKLADKIVDGSDLKSGAGYCLCLQDRSPRPTDFC